MAELITLIRTPTPGLPFKVQPVGNHKECENPPEMEEHQQTEPSGYEGDQHELSRLQERIRELQAELAEARRQKEDAGPTGPTHGKNEENDVEKMAGPEGQTIIEDEDESEEKGVIKFSNEVPNLLQETTFISYKNKVQEWVRVETDPSKKDRLPRRLFVHALLRGGVSEKSGKYAHLADIIQPLSAEYTGPEGVGLLLGQVREASGESDTTEYADAVTEMTRPRKIGASIEKYHKSFLMAVARYKAAMTEQDPKFDLDNRWTVALLLNGLKIRDGAIQDRLTDFESQPLQELNAYLARRYKVFVDIEKRERQDRDALKWNPNSERGDQRPGARVLAIIAKHAPFKTRKNGVTRGTVGRKIFGEKNSNCY